MTFVEKADPETFVTVYIVNKIIYRLKVLQKRLKGASFIFLRFCFFIIAYLNSARYSSASWAAMAPSETAVTT